MSIDGQHIIELAKITDYLLSTAHSTGPTKAQFFNAFGFDATNPVRFADALESHARSRPVVKVIVGPFGTKREVRCNIATPDGRDPCIVVIWLQPTGTINHRLITAYPASNIWQKGARIAPDAPSSP